MATYSHGYKKQSAEQTLLKIIVGIIVAVFVFVAIAFGYSRLTAWQDYKNYTTLTAYGDILDNSGAGDNYVVYLYNSSNCDTCKEIKNKVLRVGNKLNKDSETFFLADVSKMDTSDSTAKTTFLSDTSQVELVTPSIVVVANGQFYQVYSGTDDILNTLDSIKDGTFEPFQ